MKREKNPSWMNNTWTPSLAVSGERDGEFGRHTPLDDEKLQTQGMGGCWQQAEKGDIARVAWIDHGSDAQTPGTTSLSSPGVFRPAHRHRRAWFRCRWCPAASALDDPSAMGFSRVARQAELFPWHCALLRLLDGPARSQGGLEGDQFGGELRQALG